MLDLEPIRAREKAATSGPWMVAGDDFNAAVEAENETGLIVMTLQGDTRSTEELMADYAFIAAARTDIPALVEEVERLREELAWYADQSNYDIAKWGWETPADVDSGHRSRVLLTAAENKHDE